MTGSALVTTTLVRAGQVVNRTLVLPLLVFFPTSRCNSRCVSCDWWRSNGDDDLTVGEIRNVADSLGALGTRIVVFSGGEPLLRPDLFTIAPLFAERGARLHLLTSGVLLAKHAQQVARHFSRVVVSLDATTEALYRDVRGIAALGAVEEGVARLRALAPGTPITARATLHRLNFRELPRLVEHARAIGLDGISFLPADTGSGAFGRGGTGGCAASLALTREEVAEFDALIERTIVERGADFAAGFVAESPERLRRLSRHYAALVGDRPFVAPDCNAPWMSVVVEANGAVRPCFFHEPIGNVRHAPLEAIVTRELPAFRRELDIATNPVCTRCVCSIRTRWRGAPWA